MKKALFILAVMLALFGCSSDSDNTTANNVVGKWVQTSYRNTSTNSFIGQNDGTYFLFNADGTFTFYYSGWGSVNSTTMGKYKLSGSSSLPANLQLEYGNETGTISISTLDNDGNATFVVDGLLYTGTYKFQKE